MLFLVIFFRVFTVIFKHISLCQRRQKFYIRPNVIILKRVIHKRKRIHNNKSLFPMSFTILPILFIIFLKSLDVSIPTKNTSNSISNSTHHVNHRSNTVSLRFNLSKEFLEISYRTFAMSKYTKINRSYSFLLVLLSGDVNMNPGPPTRKITCPSCLKTVAKNHRAVQCDSCQGWLHIKCENISAKLYNNMIMLSDNDSLSFV